MQQKTGLVIAVVCLALVAAGAYFYSVNSYKYCFGCDAAGLYSRGTEYGCDQRADHRKVALGFLTDSATQGNLQAKLFLAELYLGDFPEGYSPEHPELLQCLREDVSPDGTVANTWYTAVLEAMNQGEELAPAILNDLALLYLQGVLPAEDQRARAISLYEKSAGQGSFHAMRTLARLYHEQGLYTQAMKWLVQAAEDPNDVTSPLQIAEYYRYGKGVDVDLTRAEEWLNKAAARIKQSALPQPEGLANEIDARLEMVRRKLAEDGGRKRMVVEYRLEGGVTHFLVYVQGVGDAPVGEVINNDGEIHATLNTDLPLIGEGPTVLENVPTMIDGMNWVLDQYARRSREDSGEMIFEFVLGKS